MSAHSRTLALVSGALAVLGCHGKPEADPAPELKVPVRCVRPARDEIDETIELPGRAVPPPGGDLPVASQVAGRIVEVLVHEGDRVSAGSVIASVDDVASRDGVRQAEAQLAQANASELNANATLERTRALVARGIAARQELDDATAKAETEKQAVSSARASIDLARRTLGRVQVRVALSGVVTTVWRGAGALVDGTAATPIVQVAGSGAEFLADATERELALIQPGQRATVQLGGAPAAQLGVVRTLSSALDPGTGLGNVRIGIDAMATAPLLGSHGRAQIVTAHRAGVLLLPSAALRGAIADGAEVVVCDGATAAVRAIKVGYRDEKRFEVTSGIDEKDEVAVDHVLGLDNGTPLLRAMNALALIKRHAAAVWMATFVLVALGIACAYDLPSSIYPEIEFPRIVVVARAGGAPPDVFLTGVTRPLEQSLTSTLGLERIRSKTIRGATEISLQFSAATDMWRALQMVEAKVSEARSDLPNGAEVVVEKVTTGSFPIVTFNLAGPIDPRDLRELADFVVRPALANVPGVGRIEVLGGDIREFEVILEPEALHALNLNPDDVAQKLRENMSLRTVGRVDRGLQLVTVLADAQAQNLRDLRALPIATSPTGAVVPLSAIAEVVEGAEDRSVRIGGPRGNTVNLSVARLPGASTPVVVDKALAAVAELGRALPAGVTIEPVYDQALLVREAMNNVRDAILIGIVLCAVVIAVFLRDVRAGVQAALAVPITLSITFVCMKLGGQTLNLMSLGGMAVAIGLVVDDAIVIVESIARHREEGVDPELAAQRGTRDLAPAVIGTTLTTVVVLVPLAFVSGVVGDFFRALAFTLMSAVLISLVVALVLVPIAEVRKTTHSAKHNQRRGTLLLARLAQAFSARPRAALVLFLATIALGLLLFPRLERGFLPTMDEGAFVVDYFLPAGTSLATTERFARGLESELRAAPEVRAFSRRLGAELGPAAATQLNRGDIMVRLTSGHARSTDEVIADLRARIAQKFPEVRVEFVQVLQDVLNDLSGNPRPVEVKILGPDYGKLNQLGQALAAKLEHIPGVVDVYAGHEHEVPELRFHANRDALALLGSNGDDLARQLETALRGSVVGAIRRYDRLINVRLRYPNTLRFDPTEVPNMAFSARGRTTTFRAVAEPEQTVADSELMHEALQPMVAVTADLEQRDLGAVANDVSAAVHQLELPKGYQVIVAGQIEGQRATLRNLSLVAAFAALLVLTVLSAQFKRLRLALLVLCAVPPAIVGATAGLVITGTPLNASSLMGMVLLVGLVVKNGVLLLEEAENRVERGEPAPDAVKNATERRLRPVVMTTTATLAGLLPLALGIGAGAELQRPLAIAVIFGLLCSTLATLGLLPAFATVALRRARIRGTEG